jgi:hypothetical protein
MTLQWLTKVSRIFNFDPFVSTEKKVSFHARPILANSFTRSRPNNSERSWQQLGEGGDLRELTKTKPNLGTNLTLTYRYWERICIKILLICQEINASSFKDSPSVKLCYSFENTWFFERFYDT